MVNDEVDDGVEEGFDVLARLGRDLKVSSVVALGLLLALLLGDALVLQVNLITYTT